MFECVQNMFCFVQIMQFGANYRIKHINETHLVRQKDSARRCREAILDGDEDEVAKRGDGTSDGLAIESNLGRKL